MSVLIRSMHVEVLEEPNMADTTTSSTSLSKRLIVAAAGIALVVAIGAAAISTDSVGALSGGKLDDGKHLLSEAEISPEEAISIALGEYDGEVDDVDLERQGSRLVYEIEIDDTDIYVDANDGTVFNVEYDDDDDFHPQSGTLGISQQSTSGDSSKKSSTNSPGISRDEAVEIAQGEVSGRLEDVDLERKSGQLVYEVEIDDTDVYIDAQDGTVLHIDYDDDRVSSIDTGNSNTSGPEISAEEAIAIARNEVDGRVDDVELERKGGRLVYEIEVGNYDVYIDATDGAVLNVEWDD